MLKASTHHLSPDGARADASFGDQPLGEPTAEQLGALLERFRSLDPAQNHAHDPYLILQSHEGKFLIRTGGGKLQLYDARDTSQPAVEFDVPGLLNAFTASPTVRAVAEEQPLIDIPPPKPMHQLLGVALLATGLGFNAWAAYTFFKPDPTDPVPVVQPVPDAAEIARLQTDLAGTYATGNGSDPGDRLIVLGPGDTVRLQSLGADRTVQSETILTGLPARLDGHLCIALPGPAGLVEVLPNGGGLRYSGDLYHRLVKK